MPVAENGMVWSQPTFIKAIKDFFTWCDDFRDEIRICEWSDSDLCQVLKEMILKDYRKEKMKAYTNPGTLTCSLGDLFDFSKYMAVSA